MTLTATSPRVNYIGTGSVSLYSFSYQIFTESDLEVIKSDADDTIASRDTLVLDTDYTVTFVAGVTGGSITLTDPLENNYNLSISRVLPLSQETDLVSQGNYYAETTETRLDKIVAQVQQVQNEVDRCPKVSETSGETGDDLIGDIEDSVAASAASAAASAASAVESSGYADDSAASAVESAASAVEASDSADEAAASVEAAGLPSSIVGEAGNILRVNSGETAYEFDSNITPVITTGDALKIVRANAGETAYELKYAGSLRTVVSKALDYTILDDDNVTILTVNDTSSDRVITLPTAADNANREITVKNTSSDGGLVTVSGEGAETIDEVNTSIVLPSRNDTVTLACDGSGWIIASENRFVYDIAAITGSYTVTGSYANVTSLTVTIPESGFYRIYTKGSVKLLDDDGSSTAASLQLAKNGTGLTDTPSYISHNDGTTALSLIFYFISTEYYGYFEEGDVVTTQAKHDSGDNTEVYYSSGNSTAFITYKKQ